MNKKDSKLVRWGIIGCGNVTEVKSGPAYQKTKGFELVAVMRRDKVKLMDYVQRHGIKKYYTNADDLINDDEIDAVYIATPPDSHRYYGLKVAEAAKPCCIEKPLAPSYEECLDIYNAFENANLPLFVAYYRRSLPRFDQIKTWIESGSIGAIRHIKWHLCKPANDLDLTGKFNWRTDANIANGGYFDDLASHGLDLFTYLLGNIKEVYGIGLNQQNLYSAKDAITACWLHDSGITGVGSWNFGSSLREEWVEIYGNTGKIEFSVFGEDPVLLINSSGTDKRFIENPKNIQLHHVSNMEAHLSGIRQHPSTGLSAVHTGWVMDKILGTL